MSDLIRWEDNGFSGYLGYVGTMPDWFCQIWKPALDGDDWVLQRAAMAGRVGKVRYGSSAGELKSAAEELLREFASSVGAVFPEPVTPLTRDGTGCDEPVLRCEDALPGCGECWEPCGEPSRFTVIRSDRDPSYDAAGDRAAAEACEAHLAGTVAGLMDGDERMTVIVQARWDA